MNFGRYDALVLVLMSSVIVIMSIVFPMIGLTDPGVNATDIPDYDISNDSVTIVGERPEYPRTATSGELHYDTDRTETWQVVLHDDGGEYQVFLETFAFNDDPPNESVRVQLSVFDTGGHFTTENYTISESDFQNETVIRLNADNNASETWRVMVVFEEVDNWNTSELDYRLSWELEESPEDAWLSDVPILGGIFATADAIASVLGWAITIVFWFAVWIVDLALSFIALVVNTILFAFSLVSFVTTNYAMIINDAQGVTKILLAIIPLIMTLEIVKIAFVFVKLLPFT